MKKVTFLVLFSLFVLRASATHNMASDISYTHVSGNTYKITVRTFTNTDPSLTQADRCEIVVYFGDNDSAMAPRINGSTNQCITADGEMIGNFIKKNIYETTHTFPGNGNYTVSIEDPNRVAGVCNIPNSVDVSFYLSAEIIINGFAVNNSSPQYTGIPMVTDTVGIVSYYTPELTESNGDSLSFELVVPMSSGMPVPGYSFPAYSTDFSMNPLTGLVTWNTPTMICNYVYAIKITEWKTIAGVTYNIGSTMQEIWNQTEPYTSLTENAQRSLIMVFPNPSSGSINFSIPEILLHQPYLLEITDLTGKQVRVITSVDNLNVITINGLSSGLYYYTFKSASEEPQRGTVVISF